MEEESAAPQSLKPSNNNNTTAPATEAARRDDAGDEEVAAGSASRSQRSSGKLPSARARLAAKVAARSGAARPLSDEATYDPPSSPPPALQKRKATTTTAAAPAAPSKKRKAEDIAAASAAKPSPKKGKTQSTTVLRRPQDSGEYWSKTEDEWEALSIADKRRFSHIGRIEESDEYSGSLIKGLQCDRCVQSEENCNVYLYEGRELFKGGRACSLCRFNNKPCSLIAAAKKSQGKAQISTKRMSKEALQQRVGQLEKQLARYKAKFGGISDSDDEDDDEDDVDDEDNEGDK